MFPVAMAEDIAQAAIRRARPADRRAMWEAVRASLTAAAQPGPEVMPWETASAVKWIGTAQAAAALKAMLAVISDPAERKRMSEISICEAERAERRAPGQRPTAQCEACYGPLPAGSRANRRTCSQGCRQKLRRIRRRG